MKNEHHFDLEINTPPAGYKASLRSRVIVGLILIAIFVPAFVLGGYVFFGLLSIFAVLAILEILFAPHRRYGWYVYVFTFLVTLGYIYWSTFKANGLDYLNDPSHFVFSLSSQHFSLEISIFGVAVSLAGYLLIAILDKNFSFSDAAYFFTFTLLVGIGFQSAYGLRYFPTYLAEGPYSDYAWAFGLSGESLTKDPRFAFFLSAMPLFYVVFGTLMNDTFAYFGGIYFGKHKLNERVSPSKTWEGFFFGVIGSWIVSLAFLLGMAAGGLPILPFLDMNHWYYIVLVCFLTPFLGDFGDLSFSLIKRALHIKDYGNILKGHGGILDRCDSILFAAIGLMILFVLIEHGWNLFL